jgi:hypothetical protein
MIFYIKNVAHEAAIVKKALSKNIKKVMVEVSQNKVEKSHLQIFDNRVLYCNASVAVTSITENTF